ncbi:hypothetical protein ABIB82_007505 [Bradyrhizobium sp. i1.8.4]
MSHFCTANALLADSANKLRTSPDCGTVAYRSTPYSGMQQSFVPVNYQL